MKNKTCFLFICLLISIFDVSCKKSVTIDPPRNQLITSAVFQDSAGAISAVTGLYVKMSANATVFGFGNGAISAYTALSSDELYPTATNNPIDNEYYTNSVTKENGTNASLWGQAYSLIYQANVCIEGINSSTTISNQLKSQLLGECKFVRSLIYFYLLNLYGDVPLIDNTNYKTNAIAPRSPQASIYQFITQDLLEARDLLQSVYAPTNRIRPAKHSAEALLARVYLYTGNWAQAETSSTTVINSANFALDSLYNVFLPASKETIWQLRPIQVGFNTAEGNIFNPTTASTARPRYGITDGLRLSFKNGDKRNIATNWIKSKVVSGIPYYYPAKYDLKSDGQANPSEYYVVLRLAEQYLIRAEAKAQQNNVSGGLADLNKIRNRAGLPSIATLTQPQLLDTILHERRLELFCEWGHRWFDLKRKNKADNVLVSIKSGWQSTDVLFPIPFVEIQRNPFLKQNPGY